MKPSPEQLEYAISQSIDGTLGLLEQASLDEVLATDAQARALFAEYQLLNSVVKSALPLPAIDYAMLSANISRAVAQTEAPVKHFQLGSFMKIMSMAAAVAILIGISIPMSRKSTTVAPVTVAKVESIIVDGPQIEVAQAPAVVDVSIAAPSNSASAAFSWHASELIVNRPSSVIIASSPEPAQDTDALPY